MANPEDDKMMGTLEDPILSGTPGSVTTIPVTEPVTVSSLGPVTGPEDMEGATTEGAGTAGGGLGTITGAPLTSGAPHVSQTTATGTAAGTGAGTDAGTGAGADEGEGEGAGAGAGAGAARARRRRDASKNVVGAFMTKDPVCLDKDMTLLEAVRVLLRNNISGAPVIEPYEGDSSGSGRLVGVLSEEDVLWKEVEATDKVSHGPHSQLSHKPNPASTQPPPQLRHNSHFSGTLSIADTFREPYLWSLMTADNLMMETVENQALKVLSNTVGLSMSEMSISVSPETPMREAASIMLDAKVKRLPVVAPRGGGQPGMTVVGIISRKDMLRHVVSLLEDGEGGEPMATEAAA